MMQPTTGDLKYSSLDIDWDVGSEEDYIIDGKIKGGDSSLEWNLGEDDETANMSMKEDVTLFDCIRGRKLVYVCAVMSSLSSILLGIDVGVMSGAKEYITPDLDLSPVQEEVVVGILNVVAAIGALMAGTTADFFGRKPTILLASVLFIIGATTMVASFGFLQMLLGRILTGLGVGCAMMITPVYITEIAPPDVRGMLVSLTDIALNGGILLGFIWTEVVDASVSSDSARWRFMLGIGLVPPVIIIICLAIMPESPRWLIIKGRSNDSMKVLRRISETKYEAKELYESISKSVEIHREEEPTWTSVLFPEHKAMRRILIIAVMLGVLQQVSGTEAAVYYSPEILKRAGWDESQVLLGTIGVGICKFGGEFVAFFCFDRIGRRPLFLLSSGLSTVFLVLLASTFVFNGSGAMVLSWVCAFVFSFSIGLGPGTFVVASEIVPLSARSKTMGLVICINRLASGTIAITFVSMVNTLAIAGSFYFFAGLSFFSVFFYALYLPETLGQTLEQVTEVLDSLEGDGVTSLDGINPPDTEESPRNGTEMVSFRQTDEL